VKINEEEKTIAANERILAFINGVFGLKMKGQSIDCFPGYKFNYGLFLLKKMISDND
jgi:hypothetical protein